MNYNNYLILFIQRIILNLDDLKVCDMAIKANYYQKVYDYFEMIRKR